MYDTYGSIEARNLSLDGLQMIFSNLGVKRLYFKILAPNDNSKNQLYFGKDLSILNIFPTGRIQESDSISRKYSTKARKKLTAELDFSWTLPTGIAMPAPEAKLILYPQYPEVRFSGFLKNSKIEISKWMQPQRSGRLEGRYLVIGITGDTRIFGFLAVPNSRIVSELQHVKKIRDIGVFSEIAPSSMPGKLDSKLILITELNRIHKLGWIQGKRLREVGVYVNCNSPNCGGYTLEAELGVLPNSIAEPDFQGWEVKQFQVSNFTSKAGKPLTLMTPEPNGGFYKEKGAEAFIRQFGYPDKNGKIDRLNFGGVHRFQQRHLVTNLTLSLRGVDLKTGKFEPDGAVELCHDTGVVAASWSFAKLLEHWKRKHNQAVYVPAQIRKNGTRYYYFGSKVLLGEGTHFMRLLNAIASGSVYYDPGIKLVGANSAKPSLKRRSQFRIRTLDLNALYDRFRSIDVTAIQPGAGG